MIGFDVSDLSEDAHQDVEGMDASAAHVLSLLSTEPSNSMLQNSLVIYNFLRKVRDRKRGGLGNWLKLKTAAACWSKWIVFITVLLRLV